MRRILSSFGFVFIDLMINGMIKLINVVEARPQLIKAAAISCAIKNKYGKLIDDIVVHAGKYYLNNLKFLSSSTIYSELL